MIACYAGIRGRGRIERHRAAGHPCAPSPAGLLPFRVGRAQLSARAVSAGPGPTGEAHPRGRALLRRGADRGAGRRDRQHHSAQRFPDAHGVVAFRLWLRPVPAGAAGVALSAGCAAGAPRAATRRRTSAPPAPRPARPRHRPAEPPPRCSPSRIQASTVATTASRVPTTDATGGDSRRTAKTPVT